MEKWYQSWIPKSKTEPFAQSAVDLMRLAKVTVDEFYEIPVSSREDLVMELADGLETLFQDYTAFVASCGNVFLFINLYICLLYYVDHVLDCYLS